MTQQDWFTSTDPQAMLDAVRDLRLCEKCGNVSAIGTDPTRCRACLTDHVCKVRVSDRKLRLFACAVARLKRPGEDVEVALSCVEAGQPNHNFNDADSRERGLFWKVCRSDEAARLAAAAYPDADVAALLREIVGNLWKPVTLAPSWLTPPVLALARDAYESRDFSALPVLWDALSEAGCQDERIRLHCLEPLHVRGCWLIDLLTGNA